MILLENREEDWWFLFSQLTGIGPKTLHKMQRFCWRNGLHPKELRERDLDGIEGLMAFSRALVATWREELDEKHEAWRLLANLRHLGVRILTPKSPSYPASLNLLEKIRPVPLLLVVGDLELLAMTGILSAAVPSLRSCWE